MAGFIGSANLLPGTMGYSDGVGGITLPSGRRLIAQPVGQSMPEGSAVTMMLRPERMRAEAGTADDGTAISGRVLHAIFQGSTVRLVVHSDDNLELIATVEADDELPPLDRGSPVTLRWSNDAVYLLQGRSAVVGATTTDVDEVQASLDGVDPVKPGSAADEEQEGSGFGRRALLAGAGVLGAAAVVGGVLAVKIGRAHV